MIRAAHSPSRPRHARPARTAAQHWQRPSRSVSPSMSQSSDDVPLAQLKERGAPAVDSAAPAPQAAAGVKEEQPQAQQERQQQAAAPAAAPAAAKPPAAAGGDDGSSSDDDAPLLARKAAVKQGGCAWRAFRIRGCQRCSHAPLRAPRCCHVPCSRCRLAPNPPMSLPPVHPHAMRLQSPSRRASRRPRPRRQQR